MKNKYMKRSVSQAMYKYIPEAWTDFYSTTESVSYSAFVKSWNSKILVDVNKVRIIDEIKFAVDSFKENNGQVVGFGKDIDIDSFEILTPKCIEDSDYSDIKVALSPLVFVCNKCNKVYSYNNYNTFLSHKDKGCIEHDCNGRLTQLQLVYSCGCGWTGPVHPRKCPAHGYDHLIYNSNVKDFVFICKKDNKRLQIKRRCPVCDKEVYPQNASDQKHTLPFSIKLIDFLNLDEEAFISKESLAPSIIIALWMKILSETEFKSIMKLENLEDADVENSEEFKKLYEKFFGMLKNEAQAKELAVAACETTNSTLEVDKALGYVKSNIDYTGDSILLKRIAISYLEFRSIKNRKKVLTIDQAAIYAREFGEILDVEEYQNASDKFKISNIQVSTDTPFVNCTYGYTRQNNDPKAYYAEKNANLVLTALKPEGNEKKNVYALKSETEGILIEFDKAKIIKWLVKNSILPESMSPNIEKEVEVSEWFINNVDINAIQRFTSIDQELNKYTYYVYSLLHTLSHGMLKTAAYLSGLDKNSLSEHIFPNNAAIFIYCQNEQGMNLGSLHSLFSSFYTKWLDESLSGLEKCMFDPVCLERDKACLGCIFINEISCNHSNKDLDRGLVIGRHDASENLYGFWEV